MDAVRRHFRDRNGKRFLLLESVWAHIRIGHPEIRDVEIIEAVLSDPDAIVESNWSESAHLYYKRVDKYYRTVVVDALELRIKTAYTTDRIKSGEILWKKRKREGR